jgi:chromosome segregation ATPase
MAPPRSSKRNFEKRVLDELEDIRRELRALGNRLPSGGGSANATEEVMADIRSKIADLASKVSQQNTVIESVNALVLGLKNAVEEAKGQLDAAGEAEAAAELDALSAALDENARRLAVAVAEGTPAYGETEGGGGGA